MVRTLQHQAKAKDTTIHALHCRVAELERLQSTKQPPLAATNVPRTRPKHPSSENVRPSSPPVTNRMKNASSSLLDAKLRLRKSQRTGDGSTEGSIELTPRKRSQLRQKQKQMKKQSSGLHLSLLQSTLLKRRVSVSSESSDSPRNNYNGSRAPRGEFGSPIES
jgi:hypothetical protein